MTGQGRSLGAVRGWLSAAVCSAMVAVSAAPVAAVGDAGRVVEGRSGRNGVVTGGARSPMAAPATASSAICPVYVAGSGSNTVSVLDASTNQVVDTVTVGGSPYGLAVSPDSKLVYTANQTADTVSVIDTDPASPDYLTVVATVPVGVGPYGLAISPDGMRVYVADKQGNTMSVIDADPLSATLRTVVATVSVGNSPAGIAVSPDGLQVYVTNQAGNSVSVIDVNPFSPTYNTAVATVPVGSYPNGIVASPDGGSVYVAELFGGKVSVIDTLLNQVSATVSAGLGASGLAMSPDGTRLYVTNIMTDDVAVVDTSTNAIIARVPVGDSPDAVAVSLDGTQVYVSNYNISSTVSVIDAQTNQSVAVPLGSGSFPTGVAAGPCGSSQSSLPPPPPPSTVSVERVAGADRFATAVAVSQHLGVVPAPVVYVASGEVFADALVAGSYAASAGGSTLLVRRDAVPAGVALELQRLAPRAVMIVGGVDAVSPAVERAIAASGVVVRRVAGADRHATAVELSKDAFPSGASTVYVASGADSADALPAGVLASIDDGPVLLVRPDAVPASTAAELARLRPERVVVVGGRDAVGAAVETALAAYAPNVLRVAGADRYATSVALSRSLFPSTAPIVFLAAGDRFADALSAVAQAGRLGGALLLTRSSCVPSDVLAEITRLQPQRIIAVGGTAVLGTGIETLTAC